MEITEDWLREEYLIKHRTLADMAREPGVNAKTLSIKAKRWGIHIYQGGRRKSADERSPKV